MTLQAGFQTERKVFKLLRLVEELPRDLPNTHNRIDRDAIEITAPTDPHAALRSMEDKASAKAAKIAQLKQPALEELRWARLRGQSRAVVQSVSENIQRRFHGL